ncbi:MAG: ABC transporter ATP-binding protein [Nitrososphaerota archaeon]|jgi:ABC-2 type transport system ATP-binding protein|nr:ABC transporter ATP-binding protein [Nitrososphaerota archaeon]MDG6956159.1 ABC transporter ATP-binding protein [Nitrososphaerota archaeon]MDG6959925.1 ABC transporter ATP-binding protein [Nitrososphaerota archaeon]MDG6965542.1 ABC transporter ATP-binding protein [Nitrososphaerota archaeon]MDG6969237.1 ABC transporter ATP-binding protein [Nitrososphaerota archaeon]
MPAIEVNGLKKKYGDIQAVGGTTFTVEEGEVFSLLGPNGAGKTTTIEILEGLRNKDAGTANVLGLDPWKSGYELHRKIGVIPQGFKFLDYPTPREAISYYGALFGKKVNPDELLKRVILDDASNVWFQNLSGGQKQKLGMALSLVNDPQVVFLDEPTTGLDPQARRAVWEVIRKLKEEGRTVMLTTHYLDEAEELADRVAIMNHGRIVAMGTTEEIESRFGSGRRMVVKGGEDLLKYLRENTRLRVEGDGDEVVIFLRDKADAMAALGAIEESGADWGDLTVKGDSLEDVFLKLVGESGTIEKGAE